MEKKSVNFKKTIPFLIGIIGVVILLLVSGEKDSGDKKTVEGMQSDIDAYTEKLEEKTKVLCEAVRGVSHVSVAITLEGGFEYEYAKNSEYGKNSYGDERREEYLVIGSGSAEKCVVIRQKLPGIAGVGIVCKGASDENVRRELLQLVSSMLNIGSNKIYITSSDQ